MKILVWIIILFFLFFFHTHGFIHYDEGWFLYAGSRLLDGEEIYRDFKYLYHPGSLYLNAFAFFLFGKSMLASRIIALINSLIAVWLIFFIGKKINLNKIILFFLVLAYIFWGAGHINFIWPVMFCMTLAIASGALFLQAYKSKHKALLLFGTGIFSALVLILKQNFGLAIFVTNLLFFMIVKQYRTPKTIFWHFFGYLSVVLLQIVYFLCTGTLTWYINEIYYFTFIKIFQQGVLNSPLPWEYHSFLPFKILKFLIYLSPFLISLFSFVKIFKNNKPRTLLYFPLIAASYYFLSIRPTTDYIHLAPLIALSTLPLAIAYPGWKTAIGKGIAVSLIFIMFFGGYTAIFQNFYKWHTPLFKQNLFLEHPRIRLWTDEKEQTNVHEITSYFEKNAKQETYLFIYSFSPIYYFILDKKNPTPYDYLRFGVSSVAIEKEIIATLKDKKVGHIITDGELSQDVFLLPKFIRTNYIPVKKVNEYTIWKLQSF